MDAGNVSPSPDWAVPAPVTGPDTNAVPLSPSGPKWLKTIVKCSWPVVAAIAGAVIPTNRLAAPRAVSIAAYRFFISLLWLVLAALLFTHR
jgi:hypothetical protein